MLCSNGPFEWMYARSLLRYVVKSHVDSRLFKVTCTRRRSPAVHPRYRFLSGRHDNPDLVVYWVQICDSWMAQVWRNKVWCYIGAEGQWFHVHDALSAFTR